MGTCTCKHLQAGTISPHQLPKVQSAAFLQVTPAKDQGRCGACAAFAAIAAIESKLLIQYGKNYSSYPIDLSEQQTIDCAIASQGSYQSMGCAGGYLEDPLAYSARCAG